MESYINITKIGVAHRFILTAPGSTGYRDGRPSYGVVYCIFGEARFRFASGNILTLSEGEAVIFSRSAAYTTHIRGEFSHYAVNFEADVGSGIEMSSDGYIHRKIEEREMFVRQLERVTAIRGRTELGSSMLALGALYTLLGMFFGELRADVGAVPRYAELDRVRRFIEENFHRDFTVADLSRMAGMSRTGLGREWSRAYSLSPFALRDRLRMERARNELALGERSVREIAEACGFSDPAYFVRFFKKHEGVTPGVYRKEARSLV